MLTKEQIAELKNQLHQQVNHLPEDKKQQAKKEIDSLSDEAVEEMLNQQKSSQDGKNIFRRIVDKEVNSIIIKETSIAIAVLDINPISKGHIMIVPKSPIDNPENLPASILSLGEQLSNTLTENLGAKSVRLETDQLFGESIIHLIPLYDKDLTKESPRNKASQEELLEVKKSLDRIKSTPKQKKVIKTKKVGRKKKPLKLKRRIA